MSELTTFRFSATEGVIEIGGSEAFVTNQLADLKELIAELASRSGNPVSVNPAASPMPISAPPTPALPPPDAPTASQLEPCSGVAAYPHTFEEMNGTLRVVADIPGDSKKAMMRSAALIYGYGSYMLGREVVSADEIRQVCQDHGCLDSPNFSKVFDDKTVFVVEGVKGGKKSVKLSFQGRKQAKQLIDGIEANAS